MSSSDHALQAYVRRKMPCRPTYRQVDPNTGRRRESRQALARRAEAAAIVM
jgi:hypothetical protein